MSLTSGPLALMAERDAAVARAERAEADADQLAGALAPYVNVIAYTGHDVQHALDAYRSHVAAIAQRGASDG